MIIKNGEKYLLTTDGWFIAPDGESYRSVWGICKIVEAKAGLGFNPIRSTNWYIEIGEGENSMIVAGCQLHYAIRCNNRPICQIGTYVDNTRKNQVPVNQIFFTE